MNTNSNRALRTLLCAASMMTGVSWGLSAHAAPAASAGSGVALEEVVVTARKQQERLQDVPLTVTALTAKTIEHLQVKSIFDLATVTPGVYFGTTGGRNGGNKLQIRNFSTGTAGPSKASVFIDGVYSPGDYASLPLANLERIEVLKGPQSAYFGRATFVGAVNFITRDPSDELTGNLDFVQATSGEHDYTGVVSAPIIKDLISEQIAYREYHFDGPQRWHTNDGLHLGGQSTRSISSKTLFKPTENLRIRAYYAHVEDDDEIPPVLYADPNARTPIKRPDGTLGYYFNGPVHYNFSAPSWGLPTTALNHPGIRHKQDRIALSYDWNVMGHSVSGYFSHAQERFKEQLDGNFYLSGTSPEIVPNAFGVPTSNSFASSFFNYDIREKDKQAEIRITSPQNQKIRYTLGYNYSKIEGGAMLRTLTGVPIFYSSAYGGSFLNPATDNSIFGGLYWDVTPQLTISVEGRYQKERIEAKAYSLAPATFGQTVSDSVGHYHAFLPRIDVQYKINRDVQVYALFAEGNNPGGFQPITLAQAQANNIPFAYAEERLKDYEVGVKSTWLDGRLVFNAAAFYMDFTNEQLSQTTPVAGTPTGFAAIYLPGVHSRVRGVEAEANAAVTEELTVRGTLGYGKAEYLNFCSVPYAALTGITTGLNCRSVNGKQQEGTPALQTSLSGDYTHHLADDFAIYLRGDWEWQSKVYNEEWDQSWIPAHSMINLRAGVEHGSWTFEGFIRNATNNDDTTRSTRVTDGRLATNAASYPPLAGIFAPGLAGQQTVAGTAKKPRQYGVRVALRF